MGRMTWNHSTFIKGLRPILEKIAAHEKVQTVVPGHFKNVRTSNPNLRIKLAPTNNGFRLTAKGKSMVQVCHIVTKLSQSELEELIR